MALSGAMDLPGSSLVKMRFIGKKSPLFKRALFIRLFEDSSAISDIVALDFRLWRNSNAFAAK